MKVKIMSEPFELYITGQAKIVAVKTQKVLMVLPETTFMPKAEEIEKLIKAQFYTPKEFKDYCTEFFLKTATQNFIEWIRSNVEVKRVVGGTKWTAQLRHEDSITIHRCPEEMRQYYHRYDAAKHEERQSMETANLNNILDAMSRIKAT